MRFAPQRSLMLVASLTVLGGMTPVTQAQQAGRGSIEICSDRLPQGRHELSCFCGSNPIGSVYGTDVYTDDSYICVAAQHAGVIDRAGGPIRVRETTTPTEFPGSTRNGVTTLGYGSNVWGGKLIRAFRVEAGGAPPAAPSVTAPAPTMGFPGGAPQMRIQTVDGRTINVAVARDQIRLIEFVSTGSAAPAPSPPSPPAAPVFRGALNTLPLARASASGYLIDLGDAFSSFDATTPDSRGWSTYPQEPTVKGVALREVLRERGRKLIADGTPNAPDVESWLRDPFKSADSGRSNPGIVPVEFAQGSEQLVTYFIDAGRTAAGELIGDFGIDNYLAVWINGEYRFGVFRPIHFSVDDLPFKNVSLGRVQPGVNVIQILRSDHFGWAGADWQIRMR